MAAGSNHEAETGVRQHLIQLRSYATDFVRSGWLKMILVLVCLWITFRKVRSRFGTRHWIEPVLLDGLLTEFTVLAGHDTQTHKLEMCRYLMRRMRKPQSLCPVKCLRITRWGRWGNQITQMLGALQIAEELEVKTIYMWQEFALLKKPFQLTADVRLEWDNVSEECLEDMFFYRVKVRDNLAFLNLTIPRETKERYLENVGIRLNDTSDDELTIHLRGGDIIVPYGHPSYAQPPCAFYDDVARERKWSRIELIAEDELNPCTARVKALGAKHEMRPFLDDLTILMSAKNVAVARGTLGIALAVFSTRLETLYTYNMSCSRLNVKRHRNCIPPDAVYKRIITRWNKIRNPKPFMLKAASGTWEDVPFGLKEKEKVYLHDSTV